MAAKIVPVILSGGSGTRLWPLSRQDYPKQLLPLNSETSLLQETARRVSAEGFAAPLVICNQEHRFMVAEQLRAIGIEPAAIALEPAGRNTAPAVIAAALMVAREEPSAQLLVLPSDHRIGDTAAFHEVVGRAARAGDAGMLVTFGIPPTRPETGYGYIRRGAALPGIEGAFAVERFVEKPPLADAEAFLAEGGYDWNSGMFLFPVAALLAEAHRLQPAVVEACEAAVAGAGRDLTFTRLAAEPFAASPSISIDHGVMEQAGTAAVVAAPGLGWSDIGSWHALWETSARDGDGNLLQGDVIAREVSGSYLRAESRLLAVLGLDDVVVVETGDAVLVADRAKSQEVKTIVEQLAAGRRSEATTHTRVYRPWGWYESVNGGERFQVKHICVHPGASLSLQMHHHRAEHWVVVQGTAEVTRGDEVVLLEENQSTYIPIGVTHRLANPGRIELRLIEIQSGSYLGEDDIVRFDDVYGRGNGEG